MKHEHNKRLGKRIRAESTNIKNSTRDPSTENSKIETESLADKLRENHVKQEMFKNGG